MCLVYAAKAACRHGDVKDKGEGLQEFATGGGQYQQCTLMHTPLLRRCDCTGLLHAS